MSKKKRDKYNEWLEKAEKAEQILWELYDEDIRGDNNLSSYALSSFKGANQLADKIKNKIKVDFVGESMAIRLGGNDD